MRGCNGSGGTRRGVAPLAGSGGTATAAAGLSDVLVINGVFVRALSFSVLRAENRVSCRVITKNFPFYDAGRYRRERSRFPGVSREEREPRRPHAAGSGGGTNA